ncbi:hypothetical protein A2U01_0064844, partial [Trifolium medium]|nr:hypothetical protein [Trifolium medium]
VKRKIIVKVKQEKASEEKTFVKVSASVAGTSVAKSTEEKKASGDKEKTVEVTVSEEKIATKKSRVKPTMKPKTAKNRAARVQRRMIVQNEDSEET